MKIKYAYIILLGGLMYMASCGKNRTVDVDATASPIVSVEDQVLYKAQLDAVLPAGLSAEDSTKMAELYIKSWINDILMYEKAKQNIIDKEAIEELVEDYRKSLITNMYQEHILKDYLNKSVSQSALDVYYEQNKELFRLDGSIIKGLYLKVPVESPQLANFQKWYKQTTDAAIENIEKNALQNAVSYEYFYDKWVHLESIMENIPYQITDTAQFLKTKKNLEVGDSSFVYLLNIGEYRLAGSDAPHEYLKNRMVDIYKEKNRTEYIGQIQEDLYKKAESDGKIKFYNK